MQNLNERKTETETQAESVSNAILCVALIRAQGLQSVLDNLSERSTDTDLMKLADRVDTYLCHAREALQALNFALSVRIKQESENKGAA